jgi:hypothetical protein
VLTRAVPSALVRWAGPRFFEEPTAATGIAVQGRRFFQIDDGLRGRRNISPLSHRRPRQIPMSYRVQADLNGSGVVIVVGIARNALIAIEELVDLGYSDVVTTDFEGRIVNRAWLEIEAASETQ